MSLELETARQQLADGEERKAAKTLWLVEAKARADFTEAQGLVEVATRLSESSDGRVRKDAELLLGYGNDYVAKLHGEAEAFRDAIVRIRSLTYLGGHGYPLEVRKNYDVAFTTAGLRVVQARHNVVVDAAYEEVEDVEITGSVERIGGGFVGGGFGLTGAAEGMAIASVLNALSARTDVNTVVRIQTRTGEIFFHSGALTAEALRMELSPVFTRLRGKDRQQGESNGDKIDRLTKLADLLERGAISPEEFAKLRADLLS
jgi:putative oligomerization/nucleic acid binding protein